MKNEIPIAEIKIGKRYRKDLGDIDSLCTSMAMLGMLQPIGVTGDMDLVFGQRRLKAALKLGWTTIPARVVKVDALLAEQDENEVRKAFTPLERHAIGEAMKAHVGERRGRPSKENGQDFGQIPVGTKTDEYIAKKCGLENRETYRQVGVVASDATPELRQALEDGLIAIDVAAQLAKRYSPEQQRQAVERMRAAHAEGKRANENLARNAVREIRRAERIDKLVTIAKGNVPLDGSIGRFPLIYADPPWRYEHTPESESREIENQYPPMDLEDIRALDVASVTTDDAILFCWATAPKLAEALSVIEAWGFSYRTCMVWDKEKIGMGYFARQQHELLLIAMKGEVPAPPPAARPPSVYRELRGEVHSAKPERFYELIEAMYPELPKLELFCRTPRHGWSAWGNQSDGQMTMPTGVQQEAAAP